MSPQFYFLLEFVYSFSGLVYDLTGDFNNSFYLGASLGLLGGCLAVIIVIREHCCKTEAKPTPEEHELRNGNKTIEQNMIFDDMGSQILYSSKRSVNGTSENV